jgi:hypothetical protein
MTTGTRLKPLSKNITMKQFIDTELLTIEMRPWAWWGLLTLILLKVLR